jgi:hypothetical protein
MMEVGRMSMFQRWIIKIKGCRAWWKRRGLKRDGRDEQGKEEERDEEGTYRIIKAVLSLGN